MLEYYICEINNAKLSLYFFIVSVIKHKIYAINPIICVFMKCVLCDQTVHPLKLTSDQFLEYARSMVC